MLTREEQKAIYDTLTGDLVINLHPEELDDFVTIPVEVHWNFEPYEATLPVIIIKWIYMDAVYERTLGDFWGNRGNGDEYGYVGANGLMVKIKAVDHGTPDDNDFISKIDIVQELVKRVQFNALTNWDGLIDEGGVQEGEAIMFNDISHILELESIKEVQCVIRINKLTTYVPVETGILDANAPTIEAIDHQIEFNN